MAESRIVEYNDTTKMIHWFYNRHEDDKRIDVTERVERFIQKVIRHCPDENFKMTRYYGFYSNRSTRHYNRMAELLAHKQEKGNTVQEGKTGHRKNSNPEDTFPLFYDTIISEGSHQMQMWNDHELC